MMQQRFPFRVTLRLAKAIAVCGDRLPFHHKQIGVWHFCGWVYFNCNKAWRSRDQRLGLLHRRFKGCGLAGLYVKQRMLKNQMLCPVFFQSARNISMPLSVSGCLTRDFKTAGAVSYTHLT